MKQVKFLQNSRYVAILLSSFVFMGIICSCSDNDSSSMQQPAIIEGTIVSYNEFGAAMLSFRQFDMENAGFSLGDVVSISVKDKEIVMPYYDGFYAFTGEYLCVAYPSYPSVCFTANNSGLPNELRGLEGEKVVIKMKETGGKKDVQEAMSMTYTYDRSDYPSDESFANARAVKGGNIDSSRMYRSSSPFSNEINRAEYVSKYLEKHGVQTVLNLADTEEKMAGYDMPAYSRTLWENGDVILCPLKSDPTAEDFNNKLIAALKVMSSRRGPYVVHCIEGKDRTGYVCALLEGLCGATYQEIVDDYLQTYENYYFINPDDHSDVCKALLTLRLNPCLMYYAGVDDEAQLPSINYGKAFSDFLLDHGMSPQELETLIHALTDEE